MTCGSVVMKTTMNLRVTMRGSPLSILKCSIVIDGILYKSKKKVLPGSAAHETSFWFLVFCHKEWYLGSNLV